MYSAANAFLEGVLWDIFVVGSMCMIVNFAVRGWIMWRGNNINKDQS